MVSLIALIDTNTNYDRIMEKIYPPSQEESTPFDTTYPNTLSKTDAHGRQLIPMDDAYMIGKEKTDEPRNTVLTTRPTLNLPSKTRYIASYTGITLSVALVICAVALVILHHGLPVIHTILQDEIALAPTLAGILAGAAAIIGAATVVHYQQRKDKVVNAHSTHPLMQEAQSSDL